MTMMQPNNFSVPLVPSSFAKLRSYKNKSNKTTTMLPPSFTASTGRPASKAIFLATAQMLLLCLHFFTLQPSFASTPSQGCKLIRKFVDATGEVDMRMLFLDTQFEEFLRQNPSVICIAWRIVGYDREAIRIQLRDFNISTRSSSSGQTPISSPNEQRVCWGNNLYIRDSDTALAKERPAVSTISGPYCGHLSEPVFWWSNGNDVVIEYHIRSLEQAKRDRFRFQFSVLTPMHGCGYEAIVYSPSMNINASTGELSSPFDRTVASHSRCYWSIVAPEDTAFLIEFLKFNIDASTPFVLTINDVYDPKYSEEGSTIIGPRCCEVSPTQASLNGNKNMKNLETYEDAQCMCLKGIPPPIQSSSNVIHIYYESRSAVLATVNQGFTLKWKHVRRTAAPTTTTMSSSTMTTTTEVTTITDQTDYDFGEITTVTPEETDGTTEDDINFVTQEAPSAASSQDVTANYNVIVSQTQSNPRVVTMAAPKSELATNSADIPIIYFDLDQISSTDGENSLHSRPRLRQTTPDNIAGNGDKQQSTAVNEENNSKSSSGPKAHSMFSASSRVTHLSKNCASLHQLSFFAPFMFAFEGIVLLN